MDLKNKIVVITGASRGLGKAMAYAFAEQGAKLVLGARSANDLKKTANEMDARAVVCDVTQEDDIKDLADKTIEKYGKIDIWINNAGIWFPHASVEDTKTENIREMLEVNLFGTIYGSKTALNYMKKQGDGIIINIISTSALSGRINASGYCASKFAQDGFSKSLCVECKDSGIKVILVYPGGMKTDFFNKGKPDDFDKFMQPDYVAEKIINNLKQDEPIKDLIIKRPNV